MQVLLVAFLLLVLLKLLRSFSHILLMLLSLELFALTLFSFFVFNALCSLSIPTLFSFLTLIVCEASCGLALLIRFARSRGDQFLLFV